MTGRGQARVASWLVSVTGRSDGGVDSRLRENDGEGVRMTGRGLARMTMRGGEDDNEVARMAGRGQARVASWLVSVTGRSGGGVDSRLRENDKTWVARMTVGDERG